MNTTLSAWLDFFYEMKIIKSTPQSPARHDVYQHFLSKSHLILCFTHPLLLQRLRTENLLLRQKMDMLEQESSDLADRLIQVITSFLFFLLSLLVKQWPGIKMICLLPRTR